jgi:arginine exporter protein ArgO
MGAGPRLHGKSPSQALTEGAIKVGIVGDHQVRRLNECLDGIKVDRVALHHVGQNPRHAAGPPEPVLRLRGYESVAGAGSSSHMSLSKKVKVGLDETRTLILGAQILLGFQLQGVFRPIFDQLPRHDRYISIAAISFISLTVGLLIAPSMQHLLVEAGDSTRRIHRSIGRFASLALAPFAVALGGSILIAVERVADLRAGIVAGLLAGGVAFLFWYGLELLKRGTTGHKERAMSDHEPPREETPLEAKIEQMLTEARVLLPGAQALLGFQLAITFMESFDKLPVSSKVMHLGALASVALTVICLMAPAAFHRIVYHGEDTEEFHALGSRFVLAASAVLALGLAGDIHVVIAKITESMSIGLAAGLAALVTLVGLWHVTPLALRLKHEPGTPTSTRHQRA